jgi:hypothetical protein
MKIDVDPHGRPVRDYQIAPPPPIPIRRPEMEELL